MRPITVDRVTMGGADTGDFHVNGFLTGISVGYMPEGFIASQVMPIVNVQRQSNIVPIVDQGPFFRRPDTLRAPATAPKEVNYTVSSDTYFARNYQLGGTVPVEHTANADPPHMPRQQTVELIKSGLMLDYEMRVQARMVVGSSVSRTAGSPSAWDNYAASFPLNDIRAGVLAIRQNRQKRPNRMIMPSITWEYVKRHPEVLKALNLGGGGGIGGVATQQAFANLVGVDQMLVPDAIVNTVGETAPDTTPVYTDVWSTSVFLYYVPANPGIMTPTYAYSFRWTGPTLPDDGPPGNFTVRERFDEGIDAWREKIGYYQDEKVLDPSLAYRIDTGILA